MLIVGADAPTFELRTVDGRRVAMSDALRAERHVLLIFLRHLG